MAPTHSIDGNSQWKEGKNGKAFTNILFESRKTESCTKSLRLRIQSTQKVWLLLIQTILMAYGKREKTVRHSRIFYLNPEQQSSAQKDFL